MSVKWGVLGTANIARGCTIPGMKMAENCELYAIAGRNEAKVQSYKDEFGFEKAYVGYDKFRQYIFLFLIIFTRNGSSKH